MIFTARVARNNTVLSIRVALTAIVTAAALAGCGGGGGSSSSDSSSTSSSSGSTTTGSASTDIVSSNGNLQTAAATSTYDTTGMAYGYYTTLNTVRVAAGAGAVNQSADLDTASQAHALYVATNLNTEGVTHTELSTSTDYYAASFTERDEKAGYDVSTGVGTEVIGGASTATASDGSSFVYGMLDSAYHGPAVLSNSTDVGFGLSAYTYGYIGVSDFGSENGKSYGQVAASGSLIAYPYDGQTGVNGTFDVSGESPRVSTTLLPNDTAGAPIIVNIQNADYVNYNAAGTLNAVVTSFTLKDSTGTAVSSVIIGNSAITGSGVTVNSDSELSAGFVELIPTSALTSGATYTASITATLKTGGTALTKTWSFTVL